MTRVPDLRTLCLYTCIALRRGGILLRTRCTKSGPFFIYQKISFNQWLKRVRYLVSAHSTPAVYSLCLVFGATSAVCNQPRTKHMSQPAHSDHNSTQPTTCTSYTMSTSLNTFSSRNNKKVG